jgi:hypothetical protein
VSPNTQLVIFISITKLSFLGHWAAICWHVFVATHDQPSAYTPLQPPITDLTIAQATPASTSSLTLHSDPDQAMAYHVADRSPFMPRGFQKPEVQGRKVMARACTLRALSLHEN